MFEIFINNFFGNATVAALMAGFFTVFFARSVYRKQKIEDRKSDMIADIVFDIVQLNEEINLVLLVMDRIANTYIVFGKDNEDEFFDKDVKNEIPIISKALNENMSILLSKIDTKINFHFSSSNKTLRQLETFKKAIKEWHDPIVQANFNLRKRIVDQNNLSTDEVKCQSKKMIEILQT